MAAFKMELFAESQPDSVLSEDTAMELVALESTLPEGSLEPCVASDGGGMLLRMRVSPRLEAAQFTVGCAEGDGDENDTPISGLPPFDLEVALPRGYPDSAPATVQSLSALWLSPASCNILSRAMEQQEHNGGPALWQWVEFLQV